MREILVCEDIPPKIRDLGRIEVSATSREITSFSLEQSHKSQVTSQLDQGSDLREARGSRSAARLVTGNQGSER